MKKFAFYVSNKGTRLKKFLQYYRDNDLVKQIEFILIDNDNNLELNKLCDDLNINYYQVDLSQENKKNIYISNLFLNYLNQHNVDYGFIFADRILVGDLLQKYKNKLINFHPAILPSHKGLYAIDQALKEHTFLLGNSAHIVTDELDGGKVIMQNIFPSINFNNYNEVLDKQIIMLLQLIDWFNSDRIYINEEKVEVIGACYNVNEFIPNIEIIDILSQKSQTKRKM